MNTDDVAIATITRVRDPDEDRLMRRALTSLARLGMPAAVADGGSGESFIAFMRELPGVTVRQTAPASGLIGQVRESFAAAREVQRRFVLYTEPDKSDFFRQGLAGFVRDAPDSEDVGIVLASRSASSFATFPPFQRLAEEAINRLCGELTGVGCDYSYGPFLLRADLAEHISGLPGDVGWGWRPFLFVHAHRAGARVVSMTGDFSCPPEQRTEAPPEMVHRMRQLQQNVGGLILATT